MSYLSLDSIIKQLPREDESHHLSRPKCTQCFSALTWSTESLAQECCGQLLRCRWTCITCPRTYCTSCFRVPTYGGFCPLLHKMHFFPGCGRQCDNCQGTITDKCHRDLHCQFDLCVECYKSNPKED